MNGLSSRLVGGGSKNAMVQIQGFVGLSSFCTKEWFPVLKLKDLEHPCKYLHLDAIYHAIAEGLEIQLAWKASEELQPIMPLAGRGRIDFSDLKGLQSFLKNPMEEIVMRVLGEAKNPFPCIMLALDLSLHQGAL